MEPLPDDLEAPEYQEASADRVSRTGGVPFSLSQDRGDPHWVALRIMERSAVVDEEGEGESLRQVV